jgi:hypothetical protein
MKVRLIKVMNFSLCLFYSAWRLFNELFLVILSAVATSMPYCPEKLAVNTGTLISLSYFLQFYPTSLNRR